MKQNVPFAPQQYFDLEGLPADGGWIWVYFKGTSTPATARIWFDSDGTVAGTNPVQLDGAGRPQPTGAWYLDPGVYTMFLFGSDGVQLGSPVDIVVAGSIFGGGSETVNQGTAIICKTYADVRGLVGSWDAVYVCGREADGDGGQGWFQREPLETGADDDGICLVAGSNRYIRVDRLEIDPRWYGVKYDSTADQYLAVLKANVASQRWGVPAVYIDNVYIQQNLVVLHNQRIKCSGGGVFLSSTGTPVTITFQGDSEFEAVGITFGPEVQPIFAKDLFPSIPLSWMGASSNEARLQKWASCSTENQNLLLDASLPCTALPVFPANMHMDWGGGLLTITAPTNFHCDIVYTGDEQMVEWSSLANIGSVWVGVRPCKPEWFGAYGDRTHDDSIALVAAIRSKDVWLNGGYRLCQQATTERLTLRGNLVGSMAVASPVSGVPDPALLLSTTGEAYTYDFDNTEVDLFSIPNLAGKQISSVAYFAGKPHLTTSNGYVYRIDNVAGVNTAVQLTSTARKHKKLFAFSDGFLYTVVSASSASSEVYLVSISGDSASETLKVTTSEPLVDVTVVGSKLYGAGNLASIFDINLAAGTTTTLVSMPGAPLGITSIGTLMYVLWYDAFSTSTYIVTSLTEGGLMVQIAQTSTKCVSIAVRASQLYVAPARGNLLSVSLAGVWSAATNNASTTGWVQLDDVNGVLYAVSTSVPDTADYGQHIKFTAAGQLALWDCAVDGSDTYTGGALLDTNSGNTTVNNSVTRLAYVLTNFFAGQDSTLDVGSFVLTPEANRQLSNCRVVGLYNDSRRWFTPNSTFESVYLDKLKNTTAYDQMLGTDIDGKVVAINEPNIEAMNVDALLVRDALGLGEKLVTAAAYTVLDNDPPVIAIDTSDNLSHDVLLPYSAGINGSKIRIIVSADPGTPGTGQVLINAPPGESMWCPEIMPIAVPVLTTQRSAVVCVFVGGKWAVC